MPSIKRIERELAARLAGPKVEPVRTRTENEAMERLARLFAANPNDPMYTGPHVTPTGRALSKGRVTRKSHDVRQRARGEIGAPLPIGMGAHPKRLTPTPKHPDCATRQVNRAEGYVISLLWTREELLKGKGLCAVSSRYRVEVAETVIGYNDDLVAAMEWIDGASRHGIDAKVIDTN